jgi:endonuclease/exonuclease/phosphatase family metal-dependent hydrolase
VFVSTGIQIEAADVLVTDLTRLASDHFPIVADISPGSSAP